MPCSGLISITISSTDSELGFETLTLSTWSSDLPKWFALVRFSLLLSSSSIRRSL